MLENKVKILIGKKTDKNIKSNDFAIFYNGKLTKYFQIYGGDINKECEEKAEIFKDFMLENNIQEYEIINGQSVDQNYSERITCEKMPEECEDIFRNCLKKYFKETAKKDFPKKVEKPRKNLL
jgi:hypothetical protein